MNVCSRKFRQASCNIVSRSASEGLPVLRTGGVSADGTMGWTEGHFTHTGPGVSATGHYVTVWVKEKGSWKVRADIGNTDPKKP